MSEPVTIWERVDHEYPDATGKTVQYAAYRTMGETGTRSIWELMVDDLRRAKHLTDAEAAAMYWASHGANTMGEGAIYWTPLSKRLTLLRFAFHDQAV